MRLRENNTNLVYLYETWVNAHRSNDYVWIDNEGKGGWKVPSGKGVRLIVLHAGGENGWIDGVDLVFKSKTNSADYHDETNSEHFLEWLKEQLLPTLEEPSVIILDNASYHDKKYNKPQTTGNRKTEIQDWLRENNIHYEDTDIKAQLLDLVKKHRTNTNLLDR